MVLLLFFLQGGEGGEGGGPGVGTGDEGREHLSKKQFSKAVFQIISNFPTQLSKSQGNSVEFCLF